MLGEATSDPRPRARVKDPELLRALHLVWRECVLCGAVDPLSLHHISKHPRDDVIGNLCMLCGSGTTGCHGLVEARDEDTVRELGAFIVAARSDVVSYLASSKGEQAAEEWMRQNLLVASPVSYPLL